MRPRAAAPDRRHIKIDTDGQQEQAYLDDSKRHSEFPDQEEPPTNSRFPFGGMRISDVNEDLTKTIGRRVLGSSQRI